MPRLLPFVTLAFLFATACSPRAFAWRDEHTALINAYRQSFAEAAGERLVEVIPRSTLIDRIAQLGTLWLGDHHRHSRLHALHTQLLRQLQLRGEQMALGLEAIGVRDERLVRQFLENRIDMATLRRSMRTRWPGSWLDDRELDPWFFRSLLEFAKRHRIPVFALEPTPRLGLTMRDAYIAKSVAAAKRRHPDRLLVILLGQSHLLGVGDVVRRSGAGGVIIGGLPTARLQAASTTQLTRGDCWRSDTNVLWFGEMFRGG